jgi:hypothetical protein
MWPERSFVKDAARSELKTPIKISEKLNDALLTKWLLLEAPSGAASLL